MSSWQSYIRHEVDFLARIPGEGDALIQVCADLSEPDTLAREIRALQEAALLYPRARKRLLVLTFDRLPGSAPEDISVRPAYEWLLEMDQSGMG